ncbi:hypothetical protein BDW75DRAFT_221481 [Aspergillus navahoensis]
MHILGLANGSIQGNSEILLKAALVAAGEKDPTITTSWIHVPSISIPQNPKPLDGQVDISLGTIDSMTTGRNVDLLPDDRQAALDAILDADAIIISTPVYSHQAPGAIKALFDRIGGPYMDASFPILVRQGQAAGDPKFANVKFDPRLQKPRVVGFMAIGGSKTPDQFTMALPSLHILVYPLHAKVVDQFIGYGVCARGAALLQPELMERARQLGRNIVSQMGRKFDEAQYLGPKDEFSCPNCYLSKIEFLDKNKSIGCVTCGTRGKLEVLPGNEIRTIWEENSVWSCITLAGKLQHSRDIATWGMEEQPKLKSVEKAKQSWLNLYVPKVPLPSDSVKPNL